MRQLRTTFTVENQGSSLGYKRLSLASVGKRKSTISQRFSNGQCVGSAWREAEKEKELGKWVFGVRFRA